MFWNKKTKLLEAENNQLNIENKQLTGFKQKFLDNLFITNPSEFNFIDGLYGTRQIRIALLYYERCSPLFMCIRRIADAFACINFTLQDKITGEFITDHPVLDLLNSNPNDLETAFEFKKELASYYLASGNVFLLLTGNVDNPPLEIWTASPINVTPNQETQNIGSYPESYFFNLFGATTGTSTIRFHIEQTPSGLRYYNKDRMKELVHVKDFNPAIGALSYFGLSKSAPLFPEIEQYIQGNINNLALLRNGARLSLALVNNNNEELTEDQYQRVKEQMEKYKGASNAGKVIVLDGLDAKEIGQSNTDMQFKEIHSSMRTAIANVYGFPLALFQESTMTLNNLQTARLLLAEDAVIPLAKTMNKKLTKLLLPRYPDTENLEFGIDLTEIEALKPEVLANTLVASQIKVNTKNELRQELGYPDIEGGDEIPTTPAPFGFQPPDEASKEFTEFAKLMKNNGKTDIEIKVLWQSLSKI